MRAHILVLLIIVGLLGAIVSATPDIRVNYDGTITIVDYNETFRVYVREIGDRYFTLLGNYTNETTIELPAGKYVIIVEDSVGNHSYIIDNTLVGKFMANPLPITLYLVFLALFIWRRTIGIGIFTFIFMIWMLMTYSFPIEITGLLMLGNFLLYLLLITYGRR